MRRVEKGRRREREPQGRQLPGAEDQSQQKSMGLVSRLVVDALPPPLCSPMTGDLDDSTCAMDILVRPGGKRFRDGTST